jgi:hypothetical protein
VEWRSGTTNGRRIPSGGKFRFAAVALESDLVTSVSQIGQTE